MNEQDMRISEDEAAMLARWAGLPMPSERLPRLALDLAAARAAVRDLRLAMPAPAWPEPAAFDPAWPEDDGSAS